MKQEFGSNPKFELSKKLKVAVLYGGTSSERKISIRSGRAVKRALERIGFKTCALDPAKRSKFRKQISQVDLAFIALHGHGGEDGQIQRTCERLNIPYIGSGPVASRQAFDKRVAKAIFRRKGIPSAPYTVVRASDCRTRARSFPVPFFVKPACEGSSIGVFSVEDLGQSAEKIRQTAAQFGPLILEKKIVGREFTVGIFGARALPVIELKPKRAFYDYRAKYTKGMTDYLVPAPIAKSLAHKLQRIALRAHRALGLRDFSRVDLMVDRAGKIYVLEANTIPGFTELSLLPKAARAAGVSFEALCYQLVEWAYRRKMGRRKLS